MDNFVDESPGWMLQPQYCRRFGGVAQKTHCKKYQYKHDDALSCHLPVTLPSRKVANLLGLWIEMNCQYAIWPNLNRIPTAAAGCHFERLVQQKMDRG